MKTEWESSGQAIVAELRPIDDAKVAEKKQTENINAVDKTQESDTDISSLSHDKVDKAELTESIEKINQYADAQKVNLLLKVDDDIGRVIVSIVDRATEEVIKQIPSAHAVDLAKKIDEMMIELSGEEPDSILNLINEKV
jgi:flagellar protein FlaG